MSAITTVDGEKISVSSYTTSDGVSGLILNISEGGQHRAASFLRPDESTALARALLPDGAAIVADPAGVIGLINDYVAMIESRNEGGRSMRWQQIRAALGIPEGD